MKKNKLKEKLQTVYDNHRIHSHPLLGLMRKRKLSYYQMKMVFQQQYYFSINFPSTVAVIYARIPDTQWKEKRKIIDLIHLEAWGSKSEHNHGTQFNQCIQYFKMSINKLNQKKVPTYTSKYLRERMAMYLEMPLSCILAGVAFNELLFQEIAKAMQLNATKLENFPMAYLNTHVMGEPTDFELFFSFLKPLLKNVQDRAWAEYGVKHILDLRAEFFDNLYLSIKEK